MKKSLSLILLVLTICFSFILCSCSNSNTPQTDVTTTKEKTEIVYTEYELLTFHIERRLEYGDHYEQYIMYSYADKDNNVIFKEFMIDTPYVMVDNERCIYSFKKGDSNKLILSPFEGVLYPTIEFVMTPEFYAKVYDIPKE